MSSQLTISTLLKEFSIQDIEKQLILHYLKMNNMDFCQSSYLSEYLDGFTPPERLCEKIAQLNHRELSQITNDMGVLMPK